MGSSSRCFSLALLADAVEQLVDARGVAGGVVEDEVEIGGDAEAEAHRRADGG